jgi:hypothetical protein
MQTNSECHPHAAGPGEQSHNGLPAELVKRDKAGTKHYHPGLKAKDGKHKTITMSVCRGIKVSCSCLPAGLLDGQPASLGGGGATLYAAGCMQHPLARPPSQCPAATALCTACIQLQLCTWAYMGSAI